MNSPDRDSAADGNGWGDLAWLREFLGVEDLARGDDRRLRAASAELREKATTSETTGDATLHFGVRHPVLERCIAMCLYPEVFFAAERAAVADGMVRHELVHVRQQREMGFGPYLLDWFRQFRANLENGMLTSEAYHSISYEREAYSDRG